MRIVGEYASGPASPAGAVAAGRAGEDLTTTLVGDSPGMRALREDIELVAGSELSVLIGGETGTGKELVARAIHENSSRSAGCLVKLNCAALPETLVESELFGHERGAFTGATRQRGGLLQQAHGGTLFLDEVGELSPTVQPKLLRALQSGEVQRVGSDTLYTVDVRIVAATNRDLSAEVAAGRFRADLYHRLSMYPLAVPPLRTRGDDILLLAGYFLERQCCRCGVNDLRLGDCARKALLGAAWPGNVRELEHVVARGVLRASLRCQRRGRLEILAGDLWPTRPAGMGSVVAEQGGPEPIVTSLREATDRFQAQLVRQTLHRHGGVRAAAARELGVDRGNFSRLLRRLQIS